MRPNSRRTLTFIYYIIDTEARRVQVPLGRVYGAGLIVAIAVAWTAFSAGLAAVTFVRSGGDTGAFSASVRRAQRVLLEGPPSRISAKAQAAAIVASGQVANATVAPAKAVSDGVEAVVDATSSTFSFEHNAVMMTALKFKKVKVTKLGSIMQVDLTITAKEQLDAPITGWLHVVGRYENDAGDEIMVSSPPGAQLNEGGDIVDPKAGTFVSVRRHLEKKIALRTPQGSPGRLTELRLVVVAADGKVLQKTIDL